MDQIHTTAATVSRLKKEAKLAVRRTQVSHSEALDSVAQAAKYADWRHVLLCAERSGDERVSRSVTMANVPDAKFIGNKPRITFVQGRPGSGKSIQATRILLDGLMSEQPCVVFDDGGWSFGKLAKMMKGTVVSLRPEGAWEVDQHGDEQFVVIDSSEVGQGKWAGQIPVLAERGFENAENALVIVDEAWYTSSRIEQLVPFVRLAVSRGGSAVICGQEGWESTFWQPFMAIEARRFSIEMHGGSDFANAVRQAAVTCGL